MNHFTAKALDIHYTKAIMPDSGIEMTVPKAEPAYVKDVNLRGV